MSHGSRQSTRSGWKKKSTILPLWGRTGAHIAKAKTISNMVKEKESRSSGASHVREGSRLWRTPFLIQPRFLSVNGMNSSFIFVSFIPSLPHLQITGMPQIRDLCGIGRFFSFLREYRMMLCWKEEYGWMRLSFQSSGKMRYWRMAKNFAEYLGTRSVQQ